jgi:LmbE family N-acetylglucosaminyl deacetylase
MSLQILIHILRYVPYFLNYRSDITKTFHPKLAALKCHKSQVGHIPRQEQEKRLREWHNKMAEGGDSQLVEAFHRVEISW